MVLAVVPVTRRLAGSPVDGGAVVGVTVGAGVVGVGVGVGVRV